MANTARISFDADLNCKRFATGNIKGMSTGVQPADAAVVLAQGGNQAQIHACSLIANKYNSTNSTGSAASAAYLPPAVAGTLVVFEWTGDVDDSTGAWSIYSNGGYAAATGGSAYSGNVFSTQVLTGGAGNVGSGKKSAASDASVTVIYTPTADANNWMGDAGSTWMFYSMYDGEWMVKVLPVASGTGATGAITFA
jgi:hypothetical protein